jgi:hypothetical protein
VRIRALADNPLFLAHWRARAETASFVAYGVVIGSLLGIFSILGWYAERGEHDGSWALWPTVTGFAVEVAILWFAAPSEVANAAATERADGTFDMHRLGPLPRLDLWLGLMGGPASMHWIVAGVMAPVVVTFGLMAHLDLATLVQGQVSIAFSAVLWTVCAALTGLDSVRLARRGHEITGVVLLPPLGALFGAYVAHTAFGALVGVGGIPHVLEALGRAVHQDLSSDVFPAGGGLFGWREPWLLVQLAVQGPFIALTSWAGVRRIADPAGSLMPRPILLPLFGMILLVVVATAIAPGRELRETHGVSAIAVAVVTTFVLGAGVALAAAPPRAELMKAIRRAARSGRRPAPWWSEVAPTVYVLVPVLALAAAVVTPLVLAEQDAAIRPVTASIGAYLACQIVALAGFREWWRLRRFRPNEVVFTVGVLFVWVIVPAFATFLPGSLGAADNDLQRALFALSPFSTVAIAIVMADAAASSPQPMSVAFSPLALDVAVAALALWLAWRGAPRVRGGEPRAAGLISRSPGSETRAGGA